MSLVAPHTLKKSVTLGPFDAYAIGGTGSVAQAKRAAMRALGTMLDDVAASNIAIITVIFVFADSRHGKYGIVKPSI